ncbi:hypothetical protein A8H37_29715 [Burkholderia thailandensis]|nr:hypothetical protein A8H37_29715 [Burkholderia thailandensis]
MPARLAPGATIGFGRRRKEPREKGARCALFVFCGTVAPWFFDGAALTAASGGLAPMTSR